MNEFAPTPHPMLPLPSREEEERILSTPAGRAEYSKLLIERETRILQARDDPFSHGFVLPWWREAAEILEAKNLLIVFGGNGSAKTWFGAWYGMRMLAATPGAQALFLHENDTSSILVQQRACFHYLPRAWASRAGQKGSPYGYDPKNGFKNNRLVTPEGALAQFGNFNQEVGAYEGTAWNLIVADENLPLAWLHTLLFRLPRARGKMLWTYTPIFGLTQAIKGVIDGARTIRHARAELLPIEHSVTGATDLPPGHMPVVQQPLDEQALIRYVWTSENPFEDQERIRRMLARESLEMIERRFYGFARGTRGSMFPLFAGHNIIELDQIPSDVTRYHIADPHGARPVFMIWAAVDRLGRHYVYREWPDYERFGEWAVASSNPRKFDGEEGPAQMPNGFTVEEYKRLILHEEGKRFTDGKWNLARGERIARRYGDPRAIKDQAIAEESGGTSFCERMVEVQRDGNGEVVGPALDFLGAPGLKIDVGVQAINDLLGYDRAKPICAGLNEPKLYVAKACRNTIHALQNWSNRDGEKSATKDPIDCLRYMATAKLFYVDLEARRPMGGGAY